MKALKARAEMMRKMPGMEHAEPNQVTLDPGKSGELVWRFTRAGFLSARIRSCFEIWRRRRARGAPVSGRAEFF